MDISSGGKRLSGFLEWWLLAEWIIREVVIRKVEMIRRANKVDQTDENDRLMRLRKLCNKHITIFLSTK